jgi:hypothetical protein
MVLLLILGVLATVGLAILLRPWPLFVTATPQAAVRDKNVGKEFAQWVAGKARDRGLNVRGVARQIPLECPKCRRSSNYFVYPDEICERCWSARLKADSLPASENRT